MNSILIVQESRNKVNNPELDPNAQDTENTPQVRGVFCVFKSSTQTRVDGVRRNYKQAVKPVVWFVVVATADLPVLSTHQT